jgi:hypothetical protein
MEIKIGDLVKFKLTPATSDLEGHKDSGIVKKKVIYFTMLIVMDI